MIKKIGKIILLLILLVGIKNTKVKAVEIGEKVENGFYKISVSTDRNKVLDVVGASNTKNTLIGMWSSNGGTHQKFRIEKKSNGNYKIMALNSELYLEVAGQNIRQNEYKNSTIQEWIFENAGNGYYYIKSVSGNLYLTEDVGTTIKLYPKDSTKSQKFYLGKIANTSGEEVVSEGYYMIKSAMNDTMVLDINGTRKINEENIHLWSKNQGSNQIFELIYESNTGTYMIKSVLSGKVFDLYGAGKTDCTNVELYTKQNVDWQKWVINKTNEKDVYTINSVYNGLFLDVTGNVSKNGTNIEVYSSTGGKNQKFKFEKVELPKGTKTIDNGFYEIALGSNKNDNIDILDASCNDEASAGIWFNNGNANQRFKVRYEQNGYYTIENVNSGLFLEEDGLSLKQRKRDNNTKAQNWCIEKNNNNYYLISASTGLCLNVNGGSYLNFNKKSTSNTQKFIFNKKANLVGTNIIPNGYYVISSMLNSGRAIDIEGASIEPEAKAIIYGRTDRNNQKFKFTYDGNGYYVITSVKSKKVLDVAWADKNNNSKLQQYTSSGNLWQKWIVEKNSDGSYCIISAYSGLNIDVPGGNLSEGTQLILYGSNGGKNQKFRLTPVDAVEGGRTISDGYYKIQSKSDKNKVLDVSNCSKDSHANIALWSNNNGYNQRFKITYRGNGYYIIKSAYSGKVLDIAGNNTNIEQDDLNYNEEQEWAIISNGNNSYNIVSAHTGKYLNANTGNQLQLSSKNSSVNQQFTFEKTTVEEGTKTISNGKYQIVTGVNGNKVLDITEASNYAGANVEIWDNNKKDNQKFNINYQGNGTYKIIAVNSGKAIAVEGAGDGNSVNVKQDYTSNSINQDWIIKYAENGYYNIISACNGLYLNVYNGNSNNGTNIEVSNKNGSSSQKFKFVEPVEIKLETGYYGSSGLKIKGDSRGSSLKYYKIGNGPNVFFGTFAVHGFEDSWNYDGQELTKIAETFKDRLISMQDENLADKWTIYLFPSVNPDGEYYGYTNNGPRKNIFIFSSTRK